MERIQLDLSSHANIDLQSIGKEAREMSQPLGKLAAQSGGCETGGQEFCSQHLC